MPLPIWSLTYQVTPGGQAQALSGAYPQVVIDVHFMFSNLSHAQVAMLVLFN